jgi:hypothetical protein
MPCERSAQTCCCACMAGGRFTVAGVGRVGVALAHRPLAVIYATKHRPPRAVRAEQQRASIRRQRVTHTHTHTHNTL